MAACCFPLKLEQFKGMDNDEAKDEINYRINGNSSLVIPCLENWSDIQKRCIVKGIKVTDLKSKRPIMTTKTWQQQEKVQRLGNEFVISRTHGVQRKKRKVEWDVEDILDVQIHADSKKILYFIKWKNWDINYNSWEPPEHLANCVTLLNNFHLKIKKMLDSCINGNHIKLQDNDDSQFKEAEKVNDVYGVVSNYIDKREEVKKKLKCWEEDINRILPANHYPITIENNFDLEGPPVHFTFINECMAGEGVVIPDDPLIGCDCEIDCFRNKKKCCVTQFDGHFAYNKAKKLVVSQGTPIYECNSRCKCGPDCFNRVVQHGPRTQLAIFRTSNNCGWGVKTLKNIKMNEFVMEYVGEIITTEEAEKRGEIYDAQGRTYLFDLDYNESDCPFTIDAAKYGNISHFMNHSCDPNLAVYGVWINTLDRAMPRLAYFSKRDISADEELTFDYMMSVSQSERDTREVMVKGILCKCGAKNCREYLV